MWTNNDRQWSEGAGFSLVELLVATAIGSITVMAISVSITNVTQLRSNGSQISVLHDLTKNIRNAVTDSASWTATLNSSLNTSVMSCLTNNTPCTPNTPVAFALLDRHGNEVFNSQMPNRGFTSAGSLCNAFSSAGNTACPIRYGLTWTAICPTSAACLDPQIHVTASVSFPTQPASMNLGNYKVDVMVGQWSEIQPIIINFAVTGSGGEGACPAGFGATVSRHLNTVLTDPGQNVTLSSPFSFQLKAGTYSCHVAVPAFAVGRTKAWLSDGGANVFYSAGAYADPVHGGSVLLSIDADFKITGTTAFQIYQACEISAGTYDLGLPAADSGGSYSATVFTSVNCNRIDKKSK